MVHQTYVNADFYITELPRIVNGTSVIFKEDEDLEARIRKTSLSHYSAIRGLGAPPVRLALDTGHRLCP